MQVKEAYIAYRNVTKINKEDLILDTPEKAANYLRLFWDKLSPDVESFVVVIMNSRRRAKCVQVVTTGTATASLAHPREVFRLAVMESATCILIAHNHPSGDPSPSSADIGITNQLKNAGTTLGIEVCDHIILGRPEYDPLGRGFFSFRFAGHI